MILLKDIFVKDIKPTEVMKATYKIGKETYHIIIHDDVFYIPTNSGNIHTCLEKIINE